MQSISISLGPCGSLTITAKFDSGADLKMFESRSKVVFDDIKNSFDFIQTNYSGVYIYTFEAENAAKEAKLNLQSRPSYREVMKTPVAQMMKDTTLRSQVSGLRAEEATEAVVKPPGSPTDAAAKVASAAIETALAELERVEAAGLLKKSESKQLKKTALNETTGNADKVRVLLDSTYMKPDDLKAVMQYLEKNATPEQLSRVKQVNVKL